MIPRSWSDSPLASLAVVRFINLTSFFRLVLHIFVIACGITLSRRLCPNARKKPPFRGGGSGFLVSHRYPLWRLQLSTVLCHLCFWLCFSRCLPPPGSSWWILFLLLLFVLPSFSIRIFLYFFVPGLGGPSPHVPQLGVVSGSGSNRICSCSPAFFHLFLILIHKIARTYPSKKGIPCENCRWGP